MLMTHKFLIFFLLTILSLEAQNFSLSVFPEEKLYEKYYADAISHQFSLNKHLESNQWFGNIGSELALFNISYSDITAQISAGATVFNTLIKTPGHIQVFTVDYLVDFYGDIEIAENFFSRFIWGHLSAHFSDDGITQLNYLPVSYVRDYMGLHFQRKIPEKNIKLYIGGFWNFHNEPKTKKHFTFQFGGDYAYEIMNDVAIFSAIDIKYKSEVEFATTQSYQLGIMFPFNRDTRFRIAYTHREGFEERGQLFNKKDNKNMLGFYIDF